MAKTYKHALQTIVTIADAWMNTEGASTARALVQMAAEAELALGLRDKGRNGLDGGQIPQGTPADEGSIPSRSTNTDYHPYAPVLGWGMSCRFQLYQDEQCGAGPFAELHKEGN